MKPEKKEDAVWQECKATLEVRIADEDEDKGGI